MFGGIIVKILAGALVLLLLAFGGYYLKSRWKERGLEKQVKELQEKTLVLDTEAKAKKAGEKTRRRLKRAARRGTDEESKVDQVISSHDDVTTRELFRRYGLLPQAADGDSPIKPGGAPRY